MRTVPSQPPRNQSNLSSPTYATDVNSENSDIQIRFNSPVINNRAGGNAASLVPNPNLEVSCQMDIDPNTQASAAAIEPSAILKNPTLGSPLVDHLRNLIKTSNLEALKRDIQELKDPNILKSLIEELENDMDSIRHSLGKEKGKIEDAQKIIQVARKYIEQGNKLALPIFDILGERTLRKIHEGTSAEDLIKTASTSISDAQKSYRDFADKNIAKFDVLHLLQERLNILNGNVNEFRNVPVVN